MTFTGRDAIWEACIILIKQSPFLGYGFGGVYKENTYTKEFIDSYINWELIGGAHNGYLDLLLNLGIFGFILVTFAAIILVVRNFKLLSLDNQLKNYIIYIYMIFILIYNFQESAFLKENYMLWNYFVYFYILIKVEKIKRKI